MTSVDVAAHRPRPASRGVAWGVRTVLRQTRYELLNFWRIPIAAVFTIGFSTLFLVLLAAAGGNSKMSALGGVRGVQYYVPGFLAYGIMSSCFQSLAISLIVRRETGLLKRLRLSPLPAWAALGAIFTSMVVVSALQVVLLLAIGAFAYHLVLPGNYLALAVTLVAGVVCFTALGVATSAVIPNQEAAGPVLGLVFFILLWLSGLWYPIRSSSVMGRISGVFPVRHLIKAAYAPFNPLPGASSWAWGDIAVMALWGAVAAVVAVRFFRWAPRRK